MEQTFDAFEYQQAAHRDEVLLAYKGPMTELVIGALSRDIQQSQLIESAARKKLFAIFIEMVDNIAHYSAEKAAMTEHGVSVGTISITQEGEAFRLTSGNRVESERVPVLLANCEKINSLDRKGLREYKRERRNAPPEEGSKGAGIGLIQTALVANDALRPNVVTLDGGSSFFSLSVLIRQQES